MTLTGKTIGQLTYLSGVTRDTLFPVELSGDTYHIPYSAFTNSNYNEGTYDELYSFATGGTLTAGSYYLMTDFQTCYDQPNYDNTKTPITTGNYKTGTTEPILLLAVSTTEFSPTVYSTLYTNDKITYDITWNTTEITSSPAKGRITERIDNFNNRTDYDNRSILFKRYDGYSYNENNPLSGLVGISIDDGGAVNNYIGNYSNLHLKFGTGDFLLANNVFLIGSFRNNTIGNGSYNNTFNDDCDNNQIGDSFYNNSTNDDFDGNIIGENFNNNYITSNFNNNRIGSDFDFNILIGGSFYRNNIGNDFNNNVWTNGDFQNNEIGNQFNNNKIYNDFYNNDIGNGYNNNESYSTYNRNLIGNGYNGNTIGTYNFSKNRIGDSFYINVISGNFQYNEIGNDFYANNIANNFSYNEIRNYFYSNLINNDFGFGGSVSQGNKIGNYFYNNNIGEYFYNNNIADNFYFNIIGNDFQLNEVKFGLNSVNLSLSTHVYANYNCTIFLRSDAQLRLSYYDSTDTLLITDVAS